MPLLGSIFSVIVVGAFAVLLGKVIIKSGGINLTGISVGQTVRIKRGRFNPGLPGDDPTPLVKITRIDGTIISGREVHTGEQTTFTSEEIISGSTLTF